MQSKDWRMIAGILAILGIVFLFGGAWIWGNIVPRFGLGTAWPQYYQYHPYVELVIIVGISFLIIALIIGIAFIARATMKLF